MKKYLPILILAVASSVSMADGYRCPPTNSAAGGWSPAECQQTDLANSHVSSGYACPAESSTAGGWVPIECTFGKKVCADCGVVESVNTIEIEDASGLGAATGAVAGGLLGNQIGKGNGKTLATLLGAVGGGVAGHYGEKYLRKKTRWDIVVLMEDGTHRTVSYQAAPDFKAGDKVKVTGNSLSKN